MITDSTLNDPAAVKLGGDGCANKSCISAVSMEGTVDPAHLAVEYAVFRLRACSANWIHYQ